MRNIANCFPTGVIAARWIGRYGHCISYGLSMPVSRRRAGSCGTVRVVFVFPSPLHGWYDALCIACTILHAGSSCGTRFLLLCDTLAVRGTWPFCRRAGLCGLIVDFPFQDISGGSVYFEFIFVAVVMEFAFVFYPAVVVFTLDFIYI